MCSLSPGFGSLPNAGKRGSCEPISYPKPVAKIPWKISINVDGYILPDRDSYGNPTVAADHGWLHLEARYNNEKLRTGSVWFGCNFNAGKEPVLEVTPMIGGVFGETSGIAPGCDGVEVRHPPHAHRSRTSRPCGG